MEREGEEEEPEGERNEMGVVQNRSVCLSFPVLSYGEQGWRILE
jgi:hypothetical protein